jgi:hypothetical protein
MHTIDQLVGKRPAICASICARWSYVRGDLDDASEHLKCGRRESHSGLDCLFLLFSVRFKVCFHFFYGTDMRRGSLDYNQRGSIRGSFDSAFSESFCEAVVCSIDQSQRVLIDSSFGSNNKITEIYKAKCKSEITNTL